MQPHYSQIAQSDRVSIQALLQAKLSCREIARKLNFHHSSISREVNRAKSCLTMPASGYCAGRAQTRCGARRTLAGARRRKLGADVDTPLWRTVLSGLRCRWSPEQIAGKLRMNSPTAPACPALPDKRSFVSHETIYCAIYAMARGTLRSELVELLRKSHKTRLPRARGSARKAGGLPNMTSIHLRPSEVAARIVPGHWEGDLIKGAMNRSSVGTLVERTSRYVMLVKLDGGCAADVLEGFKRRLKSIPPILRKTLTYDQGSEMALHETLSAKLHMDIFFCDPHSPWQRGSNEIANGLIREFLPKGMDLSLVTHQQLTAIEHSLNHRPRKILGFDSPHEVFSRLSPHLIAGVALQA